MRNLKKLFILLTLTLAITSCEDKSLNLESLDQPTDVSFYSNEQELQMALTSAYGALKFVRPGYWVIFPSFLDWSCTDISIARSISMWDGAPIGIVSPSSGGNDYSYFFRYLQRANAVLLNMEKAKSVVPEDKYNDIYAQAITLRAYCYMMLTELFGDVPWCDFKIVTVNDALIPRMAKSEIATKLLTQLEQVAPYLPFKRPDSENGRITRGFALGLRARIALYNNNYTEAAASAKALMDNESETGYSLHPDYADLFIPAQGKTSPEIMLALHCQSGFFKIDFFTAQGSRNCGSYSLAVPTQSLIDSYEATDGLPIDKSNVYSPHHPFENRDPRLKASIITPGSHWAGIIFQSHPDSLIVRNVDGTVRGSNSDCRTVSWPAAYCGYLWKKYTDEAAQIERTSASAVYNDYILMRYAEMLLIYAEAKIEQNTIDNSVLEAINRIRARAYGVDVTDISHYPAITTTDQSQLRTIIRRERLVELADEGFRLFDIRRWRIAEKVIPVVIYGQILNPATATGIPHIDADGFVSYAGIESQYDLNPITGFTNPRGRIFSVPRDYLFPIPQSDIDSYAGLGVVLPQNPGY